MSYTTNHRKLLEVILFLTEQNEMRKSYVPTFHAVTSTLEKGAKVEQKIKESKK